MQLSRTPPAAVRRDLRREVGFGCPVPGCGNPYLYWAHFDPPWNVRPHHNPEGMLALCDEHHSKADAGAFTVDQRRTFKRRGAERAQEVKGRFDWMRHRLLVVAGSNFYYETPVILQILGVRYIWLSRDDEGYLLLNIRIPNSSGYQRIRIEDNFWLSRGTPDDLKSPPSGKLLSVKYSNGDMLRVEFTELSSLGTASRRYPYAPVVRWDLSFPITAVEVSMEIPEVGIKFSPEETIIGTSGLRSSFIHDAQVALSVQALAYLG